MSENDLELERLARAAKHMVDSGLLEAIVTYLKTNAVNMLLSTSAPESELRDKIYFQINAYADLDTTVKAMVEAATRKAEPDDHEN